MQSVNSYHEFEERFKGLECSLGGRGNFLAISSPEQLKVCETQEEVGKLHEQWGLTAMNKSVGLLIERIRHDLSDIILSMPKASVLSLKEASNLRNKIEKHYGRLKFLFFNTFPSDYFFPDLPKRSFAVKLGEFKAGLVFIEYIEKELVVETRVADDVSVCTLGRATISRMDGLKVVIEDFSPAEARSSSCKTILDVVLGILHFRRDETVLFKSKQAHTLPDGAAYSSWAEYEIWVKAPFKKDKLINRTFEI
jgi:hypothetical protein